MKEKLKSEISDIAKFLINFYYRINSIVTKEF